MDRADGHRYYEGLAVAHVLGGLDDSEGQVFRAHLLECVDCRARVGELRAIAHDLADVERDERRVRAAQALDTKRRDGEDGDEDGPEVPDTTRASRVTVIVGLVLVIGLSLWNFTLRGELATVLQVNEELRDAGRIAELGESWQVADLPQGVEGAVTVHEGQFVVSVAGLEPSQYYGLYVLDESGETLQSESFQPLEGRLHRLFDLPGGAAEVVVTNPVDEGNEVGLPQSSPSGTYVFRASPPASAS